MRASVRPAWAKRLGDHCCRGLDSDLINFYDLAFIRRETWKHLYGSSFFKGQIFVLPQWTGIFLLKKCFLCWWCWSYMYNLDVFSSLRYMCSFLYHSLAHTVLGNLLRHHSPFFPFQSRHQHILVFLTPRTFGSSLFHPYLSTNILIPPFISFLCSYSACLTSFLALLIPLHVWLCVFAPAPHSKTMMDLIRPVTHTPWQPVSEFFFFFALSSCLSAPPHFPPSLVYDEQENMLTAVPSVLLIKTLAVMGVASRHRATGACQCWSVFGDG